MKDGKILKDCTLDRRIKERGKIQSSVLSNQRTAENFLENSAKATSTQLEAMSAQNSHAHPPSEVNFFKKPSKGADKSSFLKDCRFGGQAHEKERSKCLAFGTICSACQKENHFALKCAPKKKPRKTKKPRHRKPPHRHSVNQFDFDESGEEILSVSCYEEEINTIDNPSNKI